MKNISVGLMVLLSLVVANAYAQDFSETARIRYLISSVSSMTGEPYLNLPGLSYS